MVTIEKKQKLFSKNFILLLVVALAAFTAGNMLNSPLPMFALHIGGGNSLAGLVTGLFALSACICRPIFGWLLDRKGRSLVLMTGLLAFSLVTLTFNWISTISLLLLMRFVQGITMSAFSTSMSTVAADLIPKARLVEGYGYYSLVMTLSGSIGPVIGLGLVADSSFNLLFSLAAASAAVGLAIAFFMDYERSGQSGLTRPALPKTRFSLKNIFEKSAIPLSLAVFFLSIPTGIVMTFLSPYALSRGIASIGIYFTVNAAVVFLMRLFLSKLVNRLGTSAVVIGGTAMIILSMAVLIFSNSLPGFLVAAVINGIGGGVIYPVFNSLVIRFCPENRRGAANATYYIGLDIGIGGGAAIGGLISQLAGYPALFVLAVGCGVISYLVFQLSIHRQIRLLDA